MLDSSLMRSIIVRGASVFAVLVLMLALPQASSDRGIRSIVPYFCFLTFLQLAPLLWTRKPDLFAPPLITGVIAGLATIAGTIGYLVADEVQIDLVKDLDPQQMAALVQRVVIASSLGLLCYYIGYYANWGKMFRNKFPNVRGLVWDSGRVRLLSIGALVLFAVSYWSFHQRVGTSIFDIQALGAGKRAWRDDPTLSWMIRGIQLGFLPALIYLARSLLGRSTRSLLIAAGGLAAVAFLVARLGQRAVFMYVVLCALVMFHYLRRRVPAALFVALLYVAVILSNVMYQWRTKGESTTEGSFGQMAAKPLDALASHDAERQRFAALALVMHKIPSQQKYLLGETWLGLVATPIPRWLWPEKNQYFMWRDTGIVNNLGGGPIPTGYLGALYANFSWLGIAIGMLLWGVFHRSLYEWLLVDSKDVNVVLLYSLILIWFGPTLLAISSTIQFVLPIWVLLKVVGIRRPKTTVPKPAGFGAGRPHQAGSGTN